MAAAASLQDSAVGARAEEIALRLILQLIAVLLATRLVGWVARRLGQTDVSGEILAGLLLGPSCLGAVAPELMNDLFHVSTAPIFTGMAQVGLVLLMFQIGLEFEFGRYVAVSPRLVGAVSAAGIAVPFAAGFFSAPFFHAHLSAQPPLDGFRLFFAVAMSITAIPILGRIFMELGLSHTRTAAITIGSAAVIDVLGWLLLGGVAALVAGNFSLGHAAGRIGLVALFVAVVLWGVRPLLRRAVAAHLERRGRLGPGAIAWLLLAIFVSAAITSKLGVFAIIGGFVMGVALHEERRFVAEWKERIGPLVTALLLPIFFTITGLRTDIGSLHGWFGLWLCAMVLIVAFVSKFGGTYAAARLMGEGPRSACTIGVCMNTRALMELVVINIGRDLGLLPTDMFTMLVIMALASTFMATPLIRRLMRGQERAEEPLAAESR
jgi:Kef-type K+ transport system membrane component KefB